MLISNLPVSNSPETMVVAAFLFLYLRPLELSLLICNEILKTLKMCKSLEAGRFWGTDKMQLNVYDKDRQ